MDMELFEVTDNNPAGVHIMGQVASITTGLLEWGQHRAVGLLVPSGEVNICAFLLNQHMGIFDIAVNKAGMVQLHANLKFYGIGRLFHSKNILEQINPEPLGFLFLVAMACPILYKLLGSGFLLYICHIFAPFRSIFFIIISYCNKKQKSKKSAVFLVIQNGWKWL